MKMENYAELKTIVDFIENKEYDHFFVDSYQRGYKWGKKKAEDLLNDISEFKVSGDNFYCLQPVVVKKTKDGKWELIDGQQRLTTIFIILSFLEKRKFDINYKTRTSSSIFLTNFIGKNEISQDKWTNFIDGPNEAFDNIDNYHFFTAYNTIKEWFNKKSDDASDDANVKGDFYKKLTEHTKVIWYEVWDGSDSREIFTRINSGKIPLTNAELIKALFLKKPDNDNLNTEVFQLKQKEIAQEWDRIEYSLQHDEFWYFLNKSENELPTRIEFIFDLITEKDPKKHGKFHSFRHYAKKGTDEEKWQGVKKCFLTLEGWFEDREMYHLIGYLVTCGFSTIEDLKEEYIKADSKNSFKESLKQIVRKKLGISSDKIDGLEYDKDKQKITNILLLFNIETLLKSESNFRFPFDIHKKEKWSLEHIHAQQSKGLNSQEKWAAWLNEAMDLLEKLKKDHDKGGKATELSDDIKAENNQSLKKGTFESLQTKVFNFFGDSEDIHSISNLALLDLGTNIALSNHVFPVKRNIIIEKDKEGNFIPLCTKNVFLKYYRGDISQMYFWGPNDREQYLTEIKDVLKKGGYFEGDDING